MRLASPTPGLCRGWWSCASSGSPVRCLAPTQALPNGLRGMPGAAVPCPVAPGNARGRLQGMLGSTGECPVTPGDAQWHR